MINFANEKARVLTTTEIDTIISNALVEATDRGFVNPFVFERALAVFLYIYLVEEDKKAPIREVIGKDGVLEAFDTLAKTDDLKEVLEKNIVDTELVFENAKLVYDDYSKYACSVKAVANDFSFINDDLKLKEDMSAVQDLFNSEEYRNLMEEAKGWGLGNGQ